MSREPDDNCAAVVKSGLEQLLRFGGLMLSAGDTAFRARRSMAAIARAMGFETFSVQLASRSLIASDQQNRETATMVRDVGVASINTERICALEALAQGIPPGITSREFASKLTAIESKPARYSIVQTAGAVGIACGAFAFLNGSTWAEVAACMIGAGVGQGLRSFLQRRRFNQYAITALSALIASGMYCLASAAIHGGSGAVRNSVGLISSVLFLVPGFPLVTALLDQLQDETAAAGLSVVIALVGFSVESPSRPAIAKPLMLGLWALASFCGGAGLAILYNGTWRNVRCVGMIAVIGNLVRLSLHGVGLRLPLSTFLAALTVGLTASLAGRWIKEARVALTVPAVIMMVPGLYIFETLVYLNHGEMFKGLAAGVLVGFIVAAIAFGLAAARFISQPEWLKE